MRDYVVAWWNLENLFDEEGAEALGRRPEKVARAIGKGVVGWTPALRDRKIAQLATVVAGMNDGAGPDLLGVCEVENRFVVDRLRDRVNAALPAPRRYEVVHADTDDARGIDVAFLYDADLFRVPEPRDEAVFFHVVMRRNATREIVQVTFETLAGGRRLVVLGNHWPSRSGGRLESAGYRAIAGETLGYFHQRAMEVLGADTAVLAMGDFNDEPFDASLVQHALSTRQAVKVRKARTHLLWNLMWPVAGEPEGTFYFDNEPNVLDQILVNRNLVGEDAPLHVVPGSAQVHRHPAMVDTGAYPRPLPFGGMGKPVDEDGYSDHFPVITVLHETG
ncbi:Endonuclease/Exonuclease/phosphatase family protein [Isoptericola jiangsuensis]|uniref:Endonuclease/Exonuclease/phosphatase family protein n=1 Tax=Isoptericola jiangsuensis TaxID=548579 RepID=A0A2A9EW65_9MICO|nr:endonuclease/exonuclease/phosphatase family protein [Isoptericola jiangsuensis]PFG42399.1 Endonuclease/Exonuclease/phosphatase family protein [Isoptericola jiangsuensis]